MDRTKYLSAEEVERLRTVTEAECITDLKHGRRRGPLAWMVVDLALATGLRVSEIAALKLGDVDLKRKLLTITRKKKREKKATHESLAIDSELVEHLREYMVNQRQPSDKSDSLWIGKGKYGALTAQGLQLLWYGAAKRAGLVDAEGEPLYSIHCARHTLATHLLERTGNLRQVQQQLGHSSPAITARYAQVTDERMREGLEGLYARKGKEPTK